MKKRIKIVFEAEYDLEADTQESMDDLIDYLNTDFDWNTRSSVGGKGSIHRIDFKKEFLNIESVSGDQG